MQRFQDHGQTLYDFSGDFLVQCPRCQRRARVISLGESQPTLFSSRRVVCPDCGYAKDWQKSAVCFGGAVDPYFRLPLWLQTPCCEHTLWAYNREHLEFLEGYIGADLRVRAPNSNRSLASRLPGWMKDARNRNNILRGIERLRQKLG